MLRASVDLVLLQAGPFDAALTSGVLSGLGDVLAQTLMRYFDQVPDSVRQRGVTCLWQGACLKSCDERTPSALKQHTKSFLDNCQCSAKCDAVWLLSILHMLTT